jgi:hypothetical protein
MDRRSLISWVLVGLMPGCVAGSAGRAHPLHFRTSEKLAPEQVAVLGGYVGSVDDRDVRELSGPFELLPGCHLVRTRTEWGAGSTGGAVVAKTGAVPFALAMRGAHTYQIEVRSGQITGPMTSITIVTVEKDLEGNVTREIPPASSQADVDACFADEAEAARSGSWPSGKPSPGD